MESLWCALRHWRTNGHCYQSHSHVVHVHFLSYTRLSYYHLHDPCFLDEYEAVHFSGEEKSIAVFIVSLKFLTTH